MTTRIDSLAGWSDLRSGLAACLGAAWEIAGSSPYSTSLTSPYAKAYAQAARVIEALRMVSLMELQAIDDQIAQDQLVSDLMDAAKKAKKEADTLKSATKTIKKVTAIIDELTGIVGGVLKLPFV